MECWIFVLIFKQLKQWISDWNYSIRMGAGTATIQSRCSWHHLECWGDAGIETLSSDVKCYKHLKQLVMSKGKCK